MMDSGGLLVIVIGLAICFAVALVILLLVVVPGMRTPEPGERQRFRLPRQWTGYDDGVRGFFGDDETASLATREQAAVTKMREHSYVLRPQPSRHASPSLATLRPRTRHWHVPESGTGFATTLRILTR